MVKSFKQPHHIIAFGDCSAVIMPSFANGERVITVLDDNSIPFYAKNTDDPPSWANEKLVTFFGEPRLHQIIVFSDISDPDLIVTCLVALQIGFEVFAVIENPNFNNAHNLLAWVRLSDNLVTVLSMKQVLAELDLINSVPVSLGSS